MPTVTIYGANWCGDTARTQSQLKELSVGYAYVNVEVNPMGEEEVLELNHGSLKLPTVVIEGKGTRILSAPAEHELLQALRETNLLDSNVHQA